MYTYKKTQENGDATSNYDLVGKFPARFGDFISWILGNEGSFRVEFRVTNKCYGGWSENCLELVKKDGVWYWKQQKPTRLFDEIANKNITECWANGGWGQMTYFCTFEE